MMFSIGIDTEKIERFDIKNVNFLLKFLTKREFEIFNDLKGDYLKKVYVAKIWTLKEAIFKANNSLEMIAIEILLENGKAPLCVNNENLSLSLTCSECSVTAIALWKGKL